MQVIAFSTPSRPDWRWRVVDYAGETLEESRSGFATIALAVAEGARRLREMADADVPARRYIGGGPSYLRGR